MPRAPKSGVKALAVLAATMTSVGVYLALADSDEVEAEPTEAPAAELEPPPPAPPPPPPPPPRIPPYPGLEPITVGIHAVVLSDGDGGRSTATEPEQIAAAVAEAHRLYGAANVNFEFDPSKDVTFIKDDLLNSANTRRMANNLKLRRRVNRLAARWPDRITVLYRWGRRKKPTDNGFSSVRMNVVILPGHGMQARCDQQQLDTLAHEIGHYLGLRHTFSQAGFPTLEDAESAVAEKGLGPRNFDGDGMDSTPPDPFIRALSCSPPAELTVGGVRYEPPRDNLMSYYYPTREKLTRAQVERLRWALTHRLQRGMTYATTLRPRDPIEAESLKYAQKGDCREPSIRPTKDYFKQGWSGDAYLRLLGKPGCKATVRFDVPKRGTYRVRLWVTQSPESGIAELSLDKTEIDGSFDLYATVSTPFGPIDLGVHELRAGKHRLRLESAGKNERATAQYFGLDAIELQPVEEVEN